jgi:hypothetical protein
MNRVQVTEFHNIDTTVKMTSALLFGVKMCVPHDSVNVCYTWFVNRIAKWKLFIVWGIFSINNISEAGSTCHKIKTLLYNATNSLVQWPQNNNFHDTFTWGQQHSQCPIYNAFKVCLRNVVTSMWTLTQFLQHSRKRQHVPMQPTTLRGVKTQKTATCIIPALKTWKAYVISEVCHPLVLRQ